MQTTYTAIIHKTADGQFYEMTVEKTIKSDVLFTQETKAVLQTGFFKEDVAHNIARIIGNVWIFDENNQFKKQITPGQYLQLQAYFY